MQAALWLTIFAVSFNVTHVSRNLRLRLVPSLYVLDVVFLSLLRAV